MSTDVKPADAALLRELVEMRRDDISTICAIGRCSQCKRDIPSAAWTHCGSCIDARLSALADVLEKVTPPLVAALRGLPGYLIAHRMNDGAVACASAAEILELLSRPSPAAPGTALKRTQERMSHEDEARDAHIAHECVRMFGANGVGEAAMRICRDRVLERFKHYRTQLAELRSPAPGPARGGVGGEDR